jgi:hypothetical protein
MFVKNAPQTLSVWCRKGLRTSNLSSYHPKLMRVIPLENLWTDRRELTEGKPLCTIHIVCALHDSPMFRKNPKNANFSFEKQRANSTSISVSKSCLLNRPDREAHRDTLLPRGGVGIERCMVYTVALAKVYWRAFSPSAAYSIVPPCIYSSFLKSVQLRILVFFIFSRTNKSESPVTK